MGDEGTASVLTVRPALSALDAKGIDAEAALRSAGISRAALEPPENRLPYASVCTFWKEAAAASGDACFGMQVARTLPGGAYDVIEYIMSAAPSVGEGIARLTEYVRLIYDRSNMRLVVEPGAARVVRRTALPAPHYDEFTLTLLLTRSRQAAGVAWKPERVSFAHDRREGREEAARLLESPVVDYGQAQMELLFSPDILGVPHQRGDSRLLSILTRFADSLVATLPGRGDIATRVSSSIAREMATGLATLLTTAAALRISPRTLQRQLAQQGASHSALLDDVRRGLAMKYIGDAALSLGEIGYLLHFSDATAFHRAFRRWTGEAPLHYRNKLFRTAPGHKTSPAAVE